MRRTDLRSTALLVAAAVAGLVAVWFVLHQGVFGREQIVDTPVYQRYGDAMARGQVPFRDFGLEYPPGALPVFVLPALGQAGDDAGFVDRFEWLMQALGGVTILAVAGSALALRRGRKGLAVALAGPALLPLALGSVAISRFDAWPAALTSLALLALLVGRWRTGAAVLGLAFVTKVYSAVLLPLAVAAAWKQRGRREGLLTAAAFLVATLAVLVPFVILSPDGMLEMVRRQTTRPLQVESLGAGILLAAHQAFDLDVTLRSGHGSQNLDGGLPDAIGALQTVLQVLVVAGLWIGFARGPIDRERLVRGAAALVLAFVALGKVLSPQYLVWLLPLVPLVGGRRGRWGTGLLLLACVLTQLWFPYRYWDLVAPLRYPGTGAEIDRLASYLVLVRDLVLVALLWVLAGPELRDTAARALRRLSPARSLRRSR